MCALVLNLGAMNESTKFGGIRGAQDAIEEFEGVSAADFQIAERRKKLEKSKEKEGREDPHLSSVKDQLTSSSEIAVAREEFRRMWEEKIGNPDIPKRVLDGYGGDKIEALRDLGAVGLTPPGNGIANWRIRNVDYAKTGGQFVSREKIEPILDELAKDHSPENIKRLEEKTLKIILPSGKPEIAEAQTQEKTEETVEVPEKTVPKKTEGVSYAPDGTEYYTPEQLQKAIAEVLERREKATSGDEESLEQFKELFTSKLIDSPYRLISLVSNERKTISTLAKEKNLEELYAEKLKSFDDALNSIRAELDKVRAGLNNSPKGLLYIENATATAVKAILDAKNLAKELAEAPANNQQPTTDNTVEVAPTKAEEPIGPKDDEEIEVGAKQPDKKVFGADKEKKGAPARVELSPEDLKTEIEKALTALPDIEISSLSISGEGSVFKIKAKIKHPDAEFELHSELITKNGEFEISNYDIVANPLIRGFIKRKFDKNLPQLSPAVFTALGKRFGKPIQSVQIDNGSLFVYFADTAQNKPLSDSPIPKAGVDKETPPEPLSDLPEGDWWEVLGISPTATREEVKKAYRKLQKLYHVDKARDSGENSRRLNNAWDEYNNPTARRKGQIKRARDKASHSNPGPSSTTSSSGGSHSSSPPPPPPPNGADTDKAFWEKIMSTPGQAVESSTERLKKIEAYLNKRSLELGVKWKNLPTKKKVLYGIGAGVLAAGAGAGAGAMFGAAAGATVAGGGRLAWRFISAGLTALGTTAGLEAASWEREGLGHEQKWAHKHSKLTGAMAGGLVFAMGTAASELVSSMSESSAAERATQAIGKQWNALWQKFVEIKLASAADSVTTSVAEETGASVGELSAEGADKTQMILQELEKRASELGERLDNALSTPPEGSEIGASVSEVAEPYSITIEAGGSVWKAAFELGEKAGLSHSEVYEMLGNSTHLVDGKEVPLLELDLVHAGDTLTISDNPEPHFEFTDKVGDGLEAGTDLPGEARTEPSLPTEGGIGAEPVHIEVEDIDGESTVDLSAGDITEKELGPETAVDVTPEFLETQVRDMLRVDLERIYDDHYHWVIGETDPWNDIKGFEAKDVIRGDLGDKWELRQLFAGKYASDHRELRDYMRSLMDETNLVPEKNEKVQNFIIRMADKIISNKYSR